MGWPSDPKSHFFITTSPYYSFTFHFARMEEHRDAEKSNRKSGEFVLLIVTNGWSKIDVPVNRTNSSKRKGQAWSYDFRKKICWDIVTWKKRSERCSYILRIQGIWKDVYAPLINRCVHKIELRLRKFLFALRFIQLGKHNICMESRGGHILI